MVPSRLMFSLLQHCGPAGLEQPHQQQDPAFQAPGSPQHAGNAVPPGPQLRWHAAKYGTQLTMCLLLAILGTQCD